MTDGALAAKGGEGTVKSSWGTHLPVAPTGQDSARHSEDHGGVNATHNPLGLLSWRHRHLLRAAVGLPGA